MFKSITNLDLNGSLDFSLNTSVIFLGQIISKAPKLRQINISRNENRIEIINPEDEPILSKTGDDYYEYYEEIQEKKVKSTLAEGHREF